MGYKDPERANEWQRNRRKQTKEKLITEHGGKCIRCGYNKCHSALDFHHVDPGQKEAKIDRLLLNYKKSLDESRKCILVCSNCHREIHARLRELN
jgi:predicted HNH restriction endonuclease